MRWRRRDRDPDRVASARWLWTAAIALAVFTVLAVIAGATLILISEDPTDSAEAIGSGVGLVNVLVVSVVAVLAKSAYERTREEVGLATDLAERVARLEDVLYHNGRIPQEETDGKATDPTE